MKHLSVFILFCCSLLLLPSSALGLSSRLGQTEEDLLLVEEVIEGFKLALDYNRLMPDSPKYDDVAGLVREKMAALGHKPVLMWDKFFSVNNGYSNARLFVGLSFEGNKQRYVCVCSPEQEESVLYPRSRIATTPRLIRKIPLPADFRTHEFDSGRNRHILIIEEDRPLLYHGTWRGFLMMARKTGRKGQTVTALKDDAIAYTNAGMREGMAETMDKGHEYQTVRELQETLKNEKIRIPADENEGLGYGVVLEFWADRVLRSFLYQSEVHTMVERNVKNRAPLNALTPQSKQAFVLLTGIKKKLKWMDDSWNGVRFCKKPVASEDLPDALAATGTRLYNLRSRKPFNEKQVLITTSA